MLAAPMLAENVWPAETGAGIDEIRLEENTLGGYAMQLKLRAPPISPHPNSRVTHAHSGDSYSAWAR